jgi:hypothetical protein
LFGLPLNNLINDFYLNWLHLTRYPLIIPYFWFGK